MSDLEDNLFKTHFQVQAGSVLMKKVALVFPDPPKCPRLWTHSRLEWTDR